MGEVFHALEVMNRTMKLGLSSSQLLRAEMGFKSAFAQQGNPDPTIDAADPVALAEGYELVATLQPRSERMSLGDLSRHAQQASSKPRTKVDAKTLKKIDTALSRVAKEGPSGSSGA